MSVPVTASMLYDLASCPHRVTMDVFADPPERDAPNAFVELLWEHGSVHEKEAVDGPERSERNYAWTSSAELETLTRRTLE